MKIFKKPNKHQAMYLAAITQAFGVGYFTWAGVPALGFVAQSAELPQSMYDLLAAFSVYIVFTIAGYAVLDEYLTGKDEDNE